MVSEALPISRRGLGHPLRWGAAIAGTTVASVTLIDGAWGKRHWPSSPDQLIGVDPAAKEFSLTWSGIGSLDGANQSRAASLVLPGKPAYWQFSSDGTSVNALAEHLDRQTEAVETIHTNGHSLGGPVSFAVLARVVQLRIARQRAFLEQGDQNSADAVRIPKLGRVVLNCSPFDSDDPRLSKPLRLLEGVKWPVGPMSKFAFSCIRSVLEGKGWDNAWEHAKEDALSGCSPRLWLSQAKMLGGIDLRACLPYLKPLVGPATEIWYCRPEEPLLDTAVDTPQSSTKYSPWAAELGVPFRDCPVPGVGHAESWLTFQHLAQVGLQEQVAS